MNEREADAKALRPAKELKNAHNWKHLARWDGRGFYDLQTEDTGQVRVRLFFTPQLLNDTEEILYRQIVNATRFRGVRMVVITPDAHYGYGVPVGCVLITDAEAGAVAMGPVGYDIGCFTADTLVPTVDGHSHPIGELAEADGEILVYALSPEHKVVVAKATAKRTRTDAPLVKVTLDNGREITCTPDHEFMLRDGSYRQACELRLGTSLMPFYEDLEKQSHVTDAILVHSNERIACGYNHKVVSVEPLDESADVYCLTVPEYGNFALGAGVFVHNCGMAAVRTSLSASDLPDNLRGVRTAIERAIPVGFSQHRDPIERPQDKQFWDEFQQLTPAVKDQFDKARRQLGSLGGGNHFIELCLDTEQRVWMMLHSGSRGI